MFQNVLIIGATSAIAHATAREFARHGASLVLAARDASRLRALKDDLLVYKSPRVETIIFDATSDIAQSTLIQDAANLLGSLDSILIAYGSLPDTDVSEKDVQLMMNEFHLNATSIMGLCLHAAIYLTQRSQHNVQPCIAVISSVAGDRGRQSNYLYGASKGALSIFLQGLRNRLFEKRISVLTIKPGFVDTPMTTHVPKNALFASAASVGKGIYKAMISGKDVVYLPWFWRYIMFIIRIIPESMFKSMKL